MLDMTVPADRIHLEDIEVGRTVAFGNLVVTKEDIIAYAQAFDPQPIVQILDAYDNAIDSSDTGFFDAACDGKLDCFVANGHIYPNAEAWLPGRTYRQRSLFYSFDGQRFVHG